MRNLDFSSWQAVITTLLGLVVVTVMMVGIRLLVMETVQQRRNRENRQINERLRTLIAAYKTLGGSFTGELAVDPTHLRDLLASAGGGDTEAGEDISASVFFDRSRRIRDAVEGALSDVILLGTEQQVLLAARAATDPSRDARSTPMNWWSRCVTSFARCLTWSPCQRSWRSRSRGRLAPAAEAAERARGTQAVVTGPARSRTTRVRGPAAVVPTGEEWAWGWVAAWRRTQRAIQSARPSRVPGVGNMSCPGLAFDAEPGAAADGGGATAFPGS